MKDRINIIGNPVDGFQYVGPFTMEEADSYVDDQGIASDSSEWWIARLTNPESFGYEPRK